MRAPTLLLPLCLLLSACNGPDGIRFETRDAEVRAKADGLIGRARKGWALPLQVAVYFSDADGGQGLPPAQAARERRAALAQLGQLERAYLQSPFDLFRAEISVDPQAKEPRARFDGRQLALSITIPPGGADSAKVVSSGALLDAWAEGYRWERDVAWHAGEQTTELRRALRRDLGKLRKLDDALKRDCRRLELLDAATRWRAARETENGEVHFTPSEAALARASYYRSMIALFRVLNTLARWRVPYQDPAFSLRDEVLPALVYGRYLHEGYLGWLLEMLVGGRTKTKVWRRDWWHRNALYTLLDGEAELVVLEAGQRPGRVPRGSIRQLLELRLDGDLYDWFEELDAAWGEATAEPKGPLKGELEAVRRRLPAARELAKERRSSGFTAWKELWDARIKNTFTTPFYAVIRGVATLLGDTRTQHPDPAVSAAHLKRLRPTLRPGDVILARDDHYLSNAFLPGFWPHAILYLGPEKDWGALKLADGSALRDDPVVREVLGSFRGPTGDGHPARVIEAVSEGVVFSSLEHAIRKDYVVVLRPLLSEAERAAAIRTALALHGRPYDFDFDFQSDDKIVCTELVYRAYDGRLNFGRRTPASRKVPGVLEVMGRRTMPANEIARYALYMADHPDPQPTWGYPGKKLEVLAVIDRPSKKVARCTYYDGEAAVKALRATVDR